MSSRNLTFVIFFWLISSLVATAGTKAHSVAPAAAASTVQTSAEKIRFYLKDVHSLGEIKSDYDSVSVEAIKTYQYGQSQPIYKGITLILIGSLDIVSLDFEETKSLSETIPELIKVGKEWADVQKEYSEADIYVGDPVYKFYVGFYQEGTKKIIYLSSPKADVRLKSLDDISKFKDLVDQGLAWLSDDKSTMHSQGSKSSLVTLIKRTQSLKQNGLREYPGISVSGLGVRPRIDHLLRRN